MTTEDLPLMHRWINQDADVRRWWSKDAGPFQKIVDKYAPRIAGKEPTRGYIIAHADKPIGYIQEYRIGDNPEWARVVQIDEAAAGVDLFIGEADFRDRGLGAALLREFLRQVVFARPGVASCIIGPEHTNVRALRSYEKAGFKYLRTIRDPNTGETDYLMRIRREDLG